ncbi:MAG TPA: DUF427 domain-containing protein [Pseudonocardiaceae bacterium]|jgi:uncharacterized protein (DUF427 family)|nr:DUF427 domain-containing protein [Pseudonocardiaceae bacterium]
MSPLRQADPIDAVPAARMQLARLVPEHRPRVTRAHRRLRARFGGAWIADSADVRLLYESDDRPVAYFPLADVRFDLLEFRQRLTNHPQLGLTTWYAVSVNGRTVESAAWYHVEPPADVAEFADLVALSWAVMEGCYEDELRRSAAS